MPPSFMYPLTSRVVSALQMTSQPVFSIYFILFYLLLFFSVLHCLWDLANSRTVHFRMVSSRLFFYLPCLLRPFTVPCKMVLARADERGHVHTTAVCVSYHGQVFVWSDCRLDLDTNFLGGNMGYFSNCQLVT